MRGYPKCEREDGERFAKRIRPGADGCWNWTGTTNGRYGKFGTAYAHRWSYEYHRGEIPDGLEIDHLCMNKLCVNPWHLEPVTPDEKRRAA